MYDSTSDKHSWPYGLSRADLDISDLAVRAVLALHPWCVTFDNGLFHSIHASRCEAIRCANAISKHKAYRHTAVASNANEVDLFRYHGRTRDLEVLQYLYGQLAQYRRCGTAGFNYTGMYGPPIG